MLVPSFVVKDSFYGAPTEKNQEREKERRRKAIERSINRSTFMVSVDKKIIRFVRSYNKPLDGVFDIHNWNELIPLLNSF